MYKAFVVILFTILVIGTISSNAFNRDFIEVKGNPDRFTLNQNFPNPFNPSTILSYNLKVDGAVKLTIYNLVGQSVHVLVNEYQTAGFYEYSFDATSLPAGIYLYKLQVGDYSSVKRMTLVK